jgi:hypothetical protein
MLLLDIGVSLALFVSFDIEERPSKMQSAGHTGAAPGKTWSVSINFFLSIK